MSIKKSRKTYAVAKPVHRLMSSLKVKTQVELAHHLGITPQSVNSSLSRGEIPDSWLYKVAYETGCRVEYLKTGQGPEHLNEAVAEVRQLYGLPSLEQISPLVDLWKKLNERERRIIETCVELVMEGESELVGEMLQAIRRKLDAGRTKKPKTRSSKGRGKTVR